MPFIAPDHAASLERFVHEYQGARGRSIAHAPMVFQYFAHLFSDPRTPRASRGVVNAVLAYFVVPEDVLPESELGPLGLMDDLYIAAHAHRILRREMPAQVLQDAWNGDAPLDEAMAEIFSDARAELGRKTKDVLRLAGF